MAKNVWLKGTATVALLAGLGVAMSGTAHAQAVTDQTLSDVDVERVGACTTLTIKFNIRLQILSYFPSKPGRELHIRVRPLDGSTGFSARDALRPPASLPDLKSIEYEGNDPSGPLVSLYFARDMRFEVEGGSRPDSLVVKLFEPGADGSCEAVPGQPVAAAADATPADAAAAPAAPDISVPPGLYIVNAISSPDPLAELTPEQKRAVAGRVAYDSTVERDGIEWHRLRIGFFETKEQADEAAATLDALFPAAWTIKISPDEREEGIANRLDTGTLITATTGRPPIEATPEQAAEVDSLIAEAEQAIAEGNNDRAVQLLTNARALPEAANTDRAIELLGLTRERKDQTAQAQAEYEEYLRRYPSGEGTERVRQRLAALSGTGPTSTLREAEGRGSGVWAWDARGSFSQFYFRDQSRSRFVDASVPDQDPDEDDSVNLNQLLTSADVTISGGNDRSTVELRGAGSYVWNFRSGSDDIEAITALYLGYADNSTGLETRIGRQTRNSGGVFGRFDGGWIGWQASEKIKLNAIAGFPVLTSRQTRILDDRHFYGASLDFGARSDDFQSTVYVFNQEARGGFVDRRSVGAEVRFRKDRFNAFGLLDYDVHHDEVNLALATVSYLAEDTSSISFTVDYRKSPLLTTSNALIGQIGVIDALPFADLRQLLQFYTEEQIYELARDRTLTTKSVTMAYARPITEKLQANIDFTLTETSDSPFIPATPGTLEIPAQQGTGTELYAGGQLVGTGFFWDNDIYILGARYANTSRSDSYTVDFNARIPVTSKVRVSPRVRYGIREDKMIDSRYEQFQPTLRVNYYPFRSGELELEVGMNFASQRTEMATGRTTFNETGIVVTAGYRIDF